MKRRSPIGLVPGLPEMGADLVQSASWVRRTR